jgi:hypothetical protein
MCANVSAATSDPALTITDNALARQQMISLSGTGSCGGPPAISAVSASPNVLWPPNDKIVPVRVNYTVTDSCDVAPVCFLSVSSNEGTRDGSGSTSADWIVLDPHHINLRAERNGSGSGRTYTISISCHDKLKQAASAKVAVTVPHDQE